MLSLPSLPPPPSSLLPPFSLSEPTTPHIHHPHHPHHAHRRNTRPNPRHHLFQLSNEERLLSQRKRAIALYGYSWLKPAGCAKTMLGREEEMMEREEVERQLREGEVQERIAGEAEEQERQARLQQMQERGEVNPDEERNLDDDVPDADADVTQQTIDTEGTGLDEMQGDLDDDIPEASDGEEEIDEDADAEAEAASQTSGFGEGWTYDSRREPDSDDEDAFQRRAQLAPGGIAATQQARGVARAARDLGMTRTYQSPRGYDESDGVGVDEREARDLANAMLDEDELGEMDDAGERDLDENVPDADEGDWEHTDTEAEDESEMDISVLPTAPPIVESARRTRFTEGPTSTATRTRGAGVVSGNASLTGRLQTQTPTAGEIDALLTSSSAGGADYGESVPDQERERRNWLSPSSARRNLFGASRLGRGTAGGGGLFTPSPRQGSDEADAGEGEIDGQALGQAQGHRRRRSGRLIGAGGRRRENRDSLD